MTKPNHCPANERVKRRYFIRLREVRGQSTATIDSVAAALSRFEAHTGYRDFKRFHIEQVRAFKRDLTFTASAARPGQKLSSATIASTLRTLRAFFMWLADQPGYRSTVRYSDAEYFTPPAQDERIAAGRIERPGPELEQVHAVLSKMPANTPVEMRDRAIMATIILTGARDSAVISLKCKHLDIANSKLIQDAREVKTKRRKTIVTTFFPVGEAPLQIVTAWAEYATNELRLGPNDPLFPATVTTLDENSQFKASGLGRSPWSTTAPVRAIFKAAFEQAGLPYHNPHSFRSTLVRLAGKICGPPEEFKAWSQNIGHSDVLTTFSAYGKVDSGRQSEIILNLRRPVNKGDLAAEMAILLRRHGRGV